MRYAFLAVTPFLVGSAVQRPWVRPAEQQCALAVDAPRPGDQVSGSGMVSGTASLPSEASLWVLVRHQGLQGLWPQGGGPARLEEGRWSVFVTYGVPGELGTFEIAVVAVGDQADQDLRAWVRDTRPPYPPTSFPNTVEECPVRLLSVEKVSG